MEHKHPVLQLINKRDLRLLLATGIIDGQGFPIGMPNPPDSVALHAMGQCGTGLNCGGGGGVCGTGLDCSGGGGVCGTGLDCSGGGGVCGTGLDCSGS